MHDRVGRVHCQASATASIPAANARWLRLTPFGAPVVPEVYRIIAMSSMDGVVAQRCPPLRPCGTATAGRSEAGCAGPAQHVTLASPRMCWSSTGPESGDIGTTGTPASTHAVTATTVSSVGAAQTATGCRAGSSAPSALAASSNSARDIVAVPTVIASATSRVVASAGSSEVRSMVEQSLSSCCSKLRCSSRSERGKSGDEVWVRRGSPVPIQLI